MADFFGKPPTLMVSSTVLVRHLFGAGNTAVVDQENSETTLVFVLAMGL